MPSVNAKAFQVAFEKTLSKSARLSVDDVALLEKRARALADPKEKKAANEVLALVRHDRILDEREVEPARKALCRLLGVSSQRLPVSLERALTHAVPVPNVRVADYDLAFDFTDAKDAASFPATCAITLEAAAPKRTVLEIDPERLTIDDVKAGGKSVPFTVKDGRLVVDAPGTKKLHVSYRVKPTEDVSGYGLIRDRYAGRMWTLTWPYNTGALFPSSSRPDDGATARVTVQVNAGQQVVAPGRKHKDGAFHLPEPVPAYAIGFTTGKVSDMGTSTRGGYEARTAGLGSAIPTSTRKATREAVAEAMKFFSAWLGPYPFGNTLNIVEIKSAYGGMEHAGAIAIGVGQTKADTIEAAVHEAVHSWFGDGVHIAHWGELWMSEGFTNYSTFRFFEKHSGPKEFHRLLDGAKDALREQLHDEKKSAPLANHAHVDPQEGLSWVPYMHGAWMLRMLEVKHGRPTIDALIRDWYQAKRGVSVSTEDFLAFAKKEHALELRPFFAEWGRLERVPTVTDRSRIDGKSVTLSLKPKGEIPSMQVPVLIEGTRGERLRALVTPGEPLKLDAGFSVRALTWDGDRTVLVDVR